MHKKFVKRLQQLELAHAELLKTSNESVEESNGIVQRYKNPVLTAKHTPLFWRYDLDEQRNPYLMERFGINAVLNAGAIKFNDKYIVVCFAVNTGFLYR